MGTTLTRWQWGSARVVDQKRKQIAKPQGLGVPVFLKDMTLAATYLSSVLRTGCVEDGVAFILRAVPCSIMLMDNVNLSLLQSILSLIGIARRLTCHFMLQLPLF